MSYPMTPQRAALYDRIEELFSSLSPERREMFLRDLLKQSLSVAPGGKSKILEIDRDQTAVSVVRPVLRILKTPATIGT